MPRLPAKTDARPRPAKSKTAHGKARKAASKAHSSMKAANAGTASTHKRSSVRKGQTRKSRSPIAAVPTPTRTPTPEPAPTPMPLVTTAAPPLNRAARLAALGLRADRANLVRVPTAPPTLPPLEVELPSLPAASMQAPGPHAPALLPGPGPAPEPEPLREPPMAPSVPAAAARVPRGWRRLFAVGLLAVALVFVAVSSQVSSQGDPNSGTIKVHDGPTATPPERNEPHVTGDFWVEGSNMAASSGDLFFFSWPPTGDRTLVMEGNWTADGAEPANHFNAGPFDLPCGHYRVGASNGPAQASDFPSGMKKKTFWVEGCESPPPCGTEGAPPCATCGTTDTPPCPTCGTPDTPPCETCGTPDTPPCPPCGTADTPPCPTCGTQDTPPCPTCGTEDTPPCATCGTADTPPCITCPTDLTAVANPEGSVTLSWTPAAGSDGTNLYRANGTDDFDYVTTVGPGIATYTDTTTVPGQVVTYTITGLFGNAESQRCGEVEVSAIPELSSAVAVGLASAGGAVALLLARRRKA